MTPAHSILYFGKLPCRGDFVRSTSHPALIQSLDRWLSSGIELLAEDAHWKQIYDRADAAHFAMLSAHRNTAVAGHILPSADASGRRFPFLTACTIESQSGPEFMGLAPLILQDAWVQFSGASARAHGTAEADAAAALAELGHLPQPALLPADEARRQYQLFLEQTVLGVFMQNLGDTNVELNVRQIILALGFPTSPKTLSKRATSTASTWLSGLQTMRWR